MVCARGVPGLTLEKRAQSRFAGMPARARFKAAEAGNTSPAILKEVGVSVLLIILLLLLLFGGIGGGIFVSNFLWLLLVVALIVLLVGVFSGRSA
jgi:hypothetical protein